MVQHLVDLPAIWTEAVISTMNDVYIESDSQSLGLPITNTFEVVPQPVIENPSVIGISSIDGTITSGPVLNEPTVLNSPIVIP